MGEALAKTNFISVDSAIVSILNSCCTLQSQEELKNLITSRLRMIIPHSMAMLGFVDLWRFNYLNHMKIGFPDAYVGGVIGEGGQIKSPLIHCWKKKYRPFYINDLTLMAEIDPNWVELAKANNINNFLVHGVVDVSGKLASYIVLANAPQGWNPGHGRLLELVLPNLHVAMNRVLKSSPIVEDKIIKLTIREAEILKLLHGGKTNKQIAIILGISDNTVRNHVQNAFEKLGVNNRAQAVAMAVKKNLIYV